tara:strand:+ start:1217 stop:1459 length:243 start_codon:yes stop_codon:yes gene_type:complete
MIFELLTEKDQRAIATRQLKEMEAQIFAFMLLEPSKLQQSQEHVQWSSQMTGLEQQLQRFKKNVMKLGLSPIEEDAGEEE